MPLDLGQTILQLDQASAELGRTYRRRAEALNNLIRQANRVSSAEARPRTEAAADRPYLAARVTGQLLGAIPPPPPPPDWSVISVDGSHIDVDRHLPIPCYLVNLGGCILTYGSNPEAAFFNQPHLSTAPDELYLTDPDNPNNEQAVTGLLLGILRAVQELERLVEVVESSDEKIPTLALMDGTLVLWGLSGQGYRPFVQQRLLHHRYLPALERLRRLARTRPLTLAAYVSLPRATETVNAIRACLCPYDTGQCAQSCNQRRAVLPPCNAANGFLDRDIFGQTLQPGERSPLYRTGPAASREYQREQSVFFYYLNTGLEIARVEVPQWVALGENSREELGIGASARGEPVEPHLLSLGHSLIYEQCLKGQGYPVAISEAHQQAVITAQDRRLFKEMVMETLEHQNLPTYTSEKERSKTRPWL